jgi:hypothetical protein
VIDNYRKSLIDKKDFHEIILSTLNIDLDVAEINKPDTYNHFCNAYLDFLELKKIIHPNTEYIYFIDVENLIITAKTERNINLQDAYYNLRQIIILLRAIHTDSTFILVNHKNTYRDQAFFIRMFDNMYIINAKCPNSPGCEKDDFILILLLKYFEENYTCSVISHDNYSWYKPYINRATITADNPRRLQLIGHEDLHLVTKFAYSLNRV